MLKWGFWIWKTGRQREEEETTISRKALKTEVQERKVNAEEEESKKERNAWKITSCKSI